MRISVFADGADLAGILEIGRNPIVKGFTTNPTLMRKAGIDNYQQFAKQVLDAIPDRPVSFEVLSDDWEVMRDQALEIASWGKNVFVKIPITNTSGETATTLITELSRKGVQLNITALMTLKQVLTVGPCLAEGSRSYVSVFAGRIADTGRDPVPIMRSAVESLRAWPHIELIWASPRELLNVFHAEDTGCHVITMTNDLIGKLALVGKDLDEYSLETVRMFHTDARIAGYSLNRTSDTRR
jgi:transaldolase